MAIISKSKTHKLRYGSSQLRYAAVYIVLTVAVMLFLNVFSSRTSQQFFYRSKHTAMMDKVLLISSAVGEQEVLNADTALSAVESLGKLNVTRLIITDASARTVCDTLDGTSSPAFCHLHRLP